MKTSNIVIIGGGPAGSVAALTLNKLGHNAIVLERDKFPRYRVGESFLPGTLSILHRLGLSEKIEKFEYVKKPSATFLWGKNQAPWTFSFTTPKTEEWVFDHAIQVKRSEFDKMMLDTCRERGVTAYEEAPVTDVDVSNPDKVIVNALINGESKTFEADYLIDGSGSHSILANKLGIRKYDSFYKSLAIWSYFKCPDPFKSSLKGTTYSITFEDGWIWMIPQKEGVYSVGVIVDQSKVEEIKVDGQEAFYHKMLEKCETAMDVLKDSERCEKVRVVKDWSYESEYASKDRFFLCGDSACFTDPLFSQGVHLASQSAVCAASSIDYLLKNPERSDDVHAWYNRSYSETYNQYHEFLASFYTFASFTEPESEFWRKRRIAETDDERLARKQWFSKLSQTENTDSLQLEAFQDRASTMIAIGRHKRMDLTDEFHDDELNGARVQWIAKLTKQLNRIKRFEWTGDTVLAKDYFKVHPTNFTLEDKPIIASDSGKDMTKYPITDGHISLFTDLIASKYGYKELIRRLNDVGDKINSSQFVIRLIESGLLTGFDKNDKPVFIQDRLRFDGVGVDYEV